MTLERIDVNACVDEEEQISLLYKDIPDVVQQMVDSGARMDTYDQIGPIPIPSHESIVKIIRKARGILFPGFFSQSVISKDNLGYYVGQEISQLYEDLCQQIILALKNECFQCKKACSQCNLKGHKMALSFIKSLPEISEMLNTDIKAALKGDPAAKGPEEVIFCYPGLLAITVYRMANKLYHLGVPTIPRIMTEYAHSRTGIDIHPGATIGKSFFIDHGTGVVIGETTEIGDRVRLYQGVTLGALSLPSDAGERFRDTKRHPTIEEDVIIYSNTTILGGEIIIGARSIIGGNIWLTDSVPADTKVLLKRPELTYLEKSL